jgi:hypothetical protein
MLNKLLELVCNSVQLTNYEYVESFSDDFLGNREE